MISRTVTSIKLKTKGLGTRKPAVATDFRPMALNAPPTKVSYTDFIREVKDHSVIEAHYSRKDSSVKYLTVTGDYAETNVVPNDRFWDVAIDNGLNLYIDDVTMDVNVLDVAGTVFWFAFMIFLIRGVMDAQKSPGGIPGNPFTRNTDFDMDREISTRFEDVEGIDNAKDELAELVDFLKNPEKYAGTGARVPKGALLSGAPGTGKTLLARAIAGESSVPFIQCSASSFVEMFVGVGAKRVRDLFEQARANQPCIVFIDEIDAIGKKRGGTGPISNDEREQTINQLLTEMDGFDDTSQIVVIAATNRVDILDDALIRPGRFDRKIQVNLPNVTGRAKILAVHTKDKILGPDVSLKKIARQTTGFSGADLANLMNECAIRAVRDGDGTGMITEAIVEDCFQRVVVGTKNKDMIISQAKKELVAYHEAGHAIVGALMPEYDQVRKVSIISRGNAGGVTFFQPSEENQDSGLYSKQYLLAQIRVALGGMVAEEVVYGEDNATTGASNDLAQVFMIARQMITNMGFGSTLGKQNAEPQYLSEATNQDIDDEIHDLIDRCYEETRELLVENRQALELVKDELLEKEIIDGQFVYDLFKDCVELE
jgi:cell division protease FtsH